MQGQGAKFVCVLSAEVLTAVLGQQTSVVDCRGLEVVFSVLLGVEFEFLSMNHCKIIFIEIK